MFFPDKPRTLKARGGPDIEGSTVRMEGLEPPRLSAPDPKSGTATNYATSAYIIQSIGIGVMMAPDPKSAPTSRGTIPITIGNSTSAFCYVRLPGCLKAAPHSSNCYLASVVPPSFGSCRKNSFQFSAGNEAIHVKRRGKFIDNSEIRNSLSLLSKKTTF